MSNTIEIKIGKSSKRIAVPASWNDLDARTLALFYAALFTATGDEYTRGAFTAVKLISLTQHILGMSPDHMAIWEADRRQQSAEHGDLMFLEELKQVIAAALAGLFDIETDEETGATGYAVKFNLTRNPYPAMNHAPKPRGKSRKPGKVTWYYGPKDGLANLTLYELSYAFGTYEQYVATRDVSHANTLVGILYRPSRSETVEERNSAWHGDRRQPIRRYEDKVAERAKLAATLPALTRRLIVFWFAGCREAIVKQYPKVFKKAGDGEAGHGYGWGGLLLRLAESGTFGALDQTADQHFSNALTYLSMKEDERREIERQHEIAKSKRK